MADEGRMPIGSRVEILAGAYKGVTGKIVGHPRRKNLYELELDPHKARVLTRSVLKLAEEQTPLVASKPPEKKSPQDQPKESKYEGKEPQEWFVFWDLSFQTYASTEEQIPPFLSAIWLLCFLSLLSFCKVFVPPSIVGSVLSLVVAFLECGFAWLYLIFDVPKFILTEKKSPQLPKVSTFLLYLFLFWISLFYFLRVQLRLDLLFLFRLLLLWAFDLAILLHLIGRESSASYLESRISKPVGRKTVYLILVLCVHLCELVWDFSQLSQVDPWFNLSVQGLLVFKWWNLQDLVMKVVNFWKNQVEIDSGSFLTHTPEDIEAPEPGPEPGERRKSYQILRAIIVLIIHCFFLLNTGIYLGEDSHVANPLYPTLVSFKTRVSEFTIIFFWLGFCLGGLFWLRLCYLRRLTFRDNCWFASWLINIICLLWHVCQGGEPDDDVYLDLFLMVGEYVWVYWQRPEERQGVWVLNVWILAKSIQRDFISVPILPKFINPLLEALRKDFLLKSIKMLSGQAF